MEGRDDDDDKDHSQPGFAARLPWPCVRRRWPDIVGVSLLFLYMFGSYWYATKVLLQPKGALFVVIAEPILIALYVAFALSWATTVMHGPGRTPTKQSTSCLPEPVAAALHVGHQCRSKRFHAEDGWCTICSSWKPVFAHHCKQCNKCSMWMDHHCNFIGQCIGLRNCRCFIWFIGTGQFLLYGLAIVTVWDAVRQSPNDTWDYLKTGAWVYWIIQNVVVLKYQFKEIFQSVMQGWSHGVLRRKFNALLSEVQMVHSELDTVLELPQGADGDKNGKEKIIQLQRELNEAKIAVLHPSGRGLRGLFGQRYIQYSLMLIFGEPFSWRWLIPFRAAAWSTDLLVPTFCDQSACKAWMNLADVLQRACSAVDQRREAADRWALRLQQLQAASEADSSSFSASALTPQF